MNAATAFAPLWSESAMSSTTSIVRPVVFVVDDDISVRESLETLISEAGWEVRTFASAEAFLAHQRERVPNCLVLDVGLPDLNGLELQQRLASGPSLPIIFVTGRGDIPMSVQAMKAGAVEFLTKPFGAQTLLSAVRSAIEHSRTLIAVEADLQALCERYESLTTREKEVMAHVVSGQLNKRIAFELGISEVTVKVHRGRVTHKMGAASVPELVDMAARLGHKTTGKR
jgi:FixJ family two-component response regulator